MTEPTPSEWSAPGEPRDARQPEWEQSPAEPRREEGVERPGWRQKWPYWVATAASLVVIGATLLGVLGNLFSGGSSYSGRKLESDVVRVLQGSSHITPRVTCPDHIAVGAGKVAHCRASSHGQSIGVRVTCQDDKGHFSAEQEPLPQ